MILQTKLFPVSFKGVVSMLVSNKRANGVLVLGPQGRPIDTRRHYQEPTRHFHFWKRLSSRCGKPGTLNMARLGGTAAPRLRRARRPGRPNTLASVLPALLCYVAATALPSAVESGPHELNTGLCPTLHPGAGKRNCVSGKRNVSRNAIADNLRGNEAEPKLNKNQKRNCLLACGRVMVFLTKPHKGAKHEPR